MSKISFVRDKHRLTLLADGQEVFTAYAPLLEKQGLTDGEELSDEQLENLRRACLFEDTLRRAYYQLGIKDYSAAGLRKKLGGDGQITAAVVEKLCEDGYVDDGKYAASRARRLAGRGLPKTRVVAKLRFEGIDAETAAYAAADACAGDECDTIVALINARYRGRLSAEDGPRKLTATLARQGFAFEDIKTAIGRVMNGEEENGD